MPSIEELIDGIQGLVPLPKAYIRVQELVNDPNSDLDDITQVIVNDTALTGRILRIANSAYMALAAKVETVGRAVQVLGLNQVHDLALAGAAVGSLTKIEIPGLNIADFWRRSVYCAVTARTLAKRAKLRSPERLFVAGLLHDTGTLVLAHREPASYAKLLAASITTGRSMADVQREALGFDYAELGGALLQNWQLPDGIVDPVKVHTNDCETIDSSVQLDAAILQVSAAIARASMWRAEGDEPIPEFDETAMQLIELDEEGTVEVMQAADEAVIEAMSLLLPKVATKSKQAAA